MMLISLIIVMCSYLYWVCLVCPVLKNSYFNEQLSTLDTKNYAKEFKLWKVCSISYSPNVRYMVLWKIVFWSGNCHRKRFNNTVWKTQCQLKFVLHITWGKIEYVTGSFKFRGIWTSLKLFWYFILIIIIFKW